MLIAFLIMLREGIEAALIVGIVASFLKQSGHSELMPKVWLGVFFGCGHMFGYWLRHSFRYRRDSAKKTLDLLALVDAVLETQAGIYETGELSDIEKSCGRVNGNYSYKMLEPIITALTTTGSGRWEVLVEARKRKP